MYINRNVISAHTVLFVALLACVSWFVGCGPAEPPSGSVSGKVIYNGQPLSSGVVTLINEKAGIGASVKIDSSGGYHIQTIRTGEYAVAVHSVPPPPGGKFVKLDIPEKYQDLQTSGLSVTVEEGENTADLEL